MTRTAWYIAVGLVLAVFLGSGLVYGRLPDRVPTHWNIRGEVDAHGPKAVAAFVVPATLVGLLGLFAVLPRVSPSQFSMEGFRSTYGTIVVIILAMLAFVQAMALLGALGYQFNITRVVTAGMLLGLGLMGNFFGKIRRNFFVGVRVPWTLASERVWNETHRLAAWVTCGCGLLGSAVAVAGHPLIGLGFVVPIVVVPIVFSLVRYKQLEARGEV